MTLASYGVLRFLRVMWSKLECHNVIGYSFYVQSHLESDSNELGKQY